MNSSKNSIPYYQEINDFLASTPFPNRTDNPDLYCLKVEPGDNIQPFYKPPFRRSFYFMALMIDVDRSQITYDNLKEVKHNATIVFQSPGLISSFRKTKTASGYLVYFKRNCFSYFRPDFSKEFPLFDFRQTNFYELSEENLRVIEPLFEDAFADFEGIYGNEHAVAGLKVLTLLYQLKSFIADHFPQEPDSAPEDIMFRKFVRLVHDNYMEKRTVEEYAHLLSVTPKHLSRSVMEASGKKALAHINERVLEEAKSQLLYTDMDVTEICYRLSFSEPANFSKFFKKHTKSSPTEFRRRHVG